HELPKMIDDAEQLEQTGAPAVPPGGMAAAPAVQPAAQPGAGQAKYPEETVQAIMSFGVTREQAISALDAASGNPDVAASFLFP
ncbi:hypothetical protein EC988_006315, partial [Linderina pennispora]